MSEPEIAVKLAAVERELTALRAVAFALVQTVYEHLDLHPDDRLEVHADALMEILPIPEEGSW